MNILFVFFTMPHLSQSSMYCDLVNEFKKNGHHVLPMAPSIKEKRASHLSIENNIEVLRVETLDGFSDNKYKKGFANLLFSYQYKKAFNRFWKDKKIDLIIVATPSVMFANFVNHIKKLSGAKVYLMQKDIFPQNAVDLGLMKKNSVIYRFFKQHEINILKAADFIGATSKGNIKYLLNHYSFLKEENVNLLYNSTRLIDSENDIEELKKLGLEDHFLVVFGGNMGKPQQLENVLLLAENCKIFPDVLFVIIGQGTEVELLKSSALQKNLSNLRFIEQLPRDRYFNLVSNCNIGLISLHKDFTVPNTPMKLNDYLNTGIPILASIDRATDLGNILIENEMGLFAYADSSDDLLSAFKKLYENPDLCKKFGENGKRFCLENLSVEKTYKEIVQTVNH